MTSDLYLEHMLNTVTDDEWEEHRRQEEEADYYTWRMWDSYDERAAVAGYLGNRTIHRRPTMTPEELFCTMLLAMTGDDEPRVNEQDEAQEAQEAEEREGES